MLLSYIPGCTARASQQQEATLSTRRWIFQVLDRPRYFSLYTYNKSRGIHYLKRKLRENRFFFKLFLKIVCLIKSTIKKLGKPQVGGKYSQGTYLERCLYIEYTKNYNPKS